MWWNIPNLLCLFRLAAVPALMVLAWAGQRELFLILLTCSLVTDTLDGMIARRLHQTSALGTKLDTYADFAMYSTVPILAWYLWPNIIQREASFVIAVFICAVIPVILGVLKFGKLPAYHTYGAKLSAVLMGTSVLFMFATGISWPFRAAVPILFLTSLEEIAITALLPRWHANVRSIWQARKIVLKERTDDDE